MNVETLFHQALEKPAGARAAFLNETCGGDATLRQRVEVLLRAHENPGSFMDRPAVGPEAARAFADAAAKPASGAGQDSVSYQTTTDAIEPATTDVPADPGDTIGPYRLLQRLGEGGMGTVWMAGQSKPVQRKVALKFIKPGMDSRQVLARFEAERQALALMDHPNIAKVLDGGATENGRPYFVMELVKGVPITKYCDEHRLTPRERLELFVPVCHAIQHAHQKGIIHRDVKPNNILVAPYDGRPVVKVIDFGVAKATGQRLTERTLFTEFGQVVGTLEYMSPEQAELNNQDIDTRSDIYSLGVLVYELLTGTTPLDRARLKEATFTVMLRMIREQEPPKPSTRLSESRDALPSISAQRHMEPAKLTKLIRGELDWIVMKCLEKDRGLRYETANGLAMDVQRYLNDEQVLACPPSAAYRLRKFARRNKRALSVAGLAVSFLMILGGGIGWVARDHAARRSAIDAELNLALNEVLHLKEQCRYPEAASAARLAEMRAAGGASSDIQSRARVLRKDMDMVQRLEEIRFLEGTRVEKDTFDFADADRAYARAFRDYEIDVERIETGAAADCVRARGIRVELAAALQDWAKVRRQSRGQSDAGWKDRLTLARAADPDPWRNRLRDIYERWYSKAPVANAFEELAASAPLDRLPPSTLALLGQGLADGSSTEHAVGFLLKAHRLYPGDFWINFYLGWCYGRDQPEEAIRFYTAALVIRPRSSAVHNNLGFALNRKGRVDDAISAYREAIRLKPQNFRPHDNLASALHAKGRVEEAIAEYREATRLMPKNPDRHVNLAITLMANNRVDEAIAEYREAIRLKPDVPDFHYGLSAALAQQGHLDDAFAASQGAHRLKLGGPRNPADLVNLAEALYQQGKKTQARQLQEQQIAYLLATLKSNPKTPGHQQWLWDNYLVLADNANLKHDELAKVAEEFPRLLPDQQDQCVRAAWYLCRCARDVHRDDALPADHRTQLAERYALRAVEMLRQSIAKGNKDANRLKTDSAFEPIRSREDFQKLVAELEHKTP